VKSDDEWSEDVKRMLRAEMVRRGITYEQLSEKLAVIGVIDSAANIRHGGVLGPMSLRYGRAGA
jgi:hypothetical protein